MDRALVSGSLFRSRLQAPARSGKTCRQSTSLVLFFAIAPRMALSFRHFSGQVAPHDPVPVAGHLAHETAQPPRADLAAHLAQGEGRAEGVEEIPLENVRLVARVLLHELPRPLGRL